MNALRIGISTNWILSSLFSSKFDLLKNFKALTINHVFREANGEVHQLANMGTLNDKFIKASYSLMVEISAPILV